MSTPLVCLTLALALVSGVGADETQDRRAQSGARLFRSLLAADLALGDKTLPDDRLLVVFFYVDDRRRADELAKRFLGEGSEADKIRGLPATAELSSDPAFAEYGKRVPAGIFLAQPPSDATLKAIVRWGIEHHVIVYSPFEGHVESGVHGGLAVEAQVRPYVNAATLAASQIQLKPFFLKVSKVYP